METRGEHQQTDGEQGVIDEQMPDGSARARTSELREEKHKGLEGYSGEVIAQLARFKVSKFNPEITTSPLVYAGNLNGRLISVLESGEGTMDGMSLSADDSIELVRLIKLAQSLNHNDKMGIGEVAREDRREQTHQTLMEALGREE